MSESLKEIVLELIEDGRKVTAVKTVRSQTGWDLREAKTYVDRLANDRPVGHPYLSQTEIMASVKVTLRSQGKMDAIRQLREEPGWGIQEAIDFIEELANKNK